MGRRKEDSPRPAPKIIQDVYDLRAAEAVRQQAEKERKRLLQERAIQVKDKAATLLRENIQDPDTVVLKPQKKSTRAQLLKNLRGQDERDFRRMNQSRSEREADDYKFKANFLIPGVDGTVNVQLASLYYPEGLTGRTLRVDILILPHTFEIVTDNQTGNVELSLLSREDTFYPNDPDRIGSPGRNYPKYHHYASLEQADEVLELLDFIEVGISSREIKTRDMSSQSEMERVARSRQRKREATVSSVSSS